MYHQIKLHLKLIGNEMIVCLYFFGFSTALHYTTLYFTLFIDNYSGLKKYGKAGITVCKQIG